MRFVHGQLIIVLAPFIDHEIYSNLKQFDENTLVLETKTHNDIPVNQELLCIAVGDNKMFEFYTQADVKQGKLLFVKKPKADKLNAIEKRNFNRIDCRIDFVGTLLSLNNKPITNLTKKFTGTILNISSGGILVGTNLNLPVGMVYSFKLKLNYYIDCKAMVVRTNATTSQGVYQSGCQFIDLDLDSIKAISFYAFQEQMKKKRNDLKN